MTDEPVADPVGAAVATAPNRSLLETDAGARYSATELDAKVGRRAAGLRAGGVDSGDRVAVVINDRLEAVVTLFGAIRAGAVAAPLDPSAPPEETADRLGAGDIDALVTDDDALEAAVTPPTLAPVDADDGIPPSPIPADRPVTLVFTSGTTGEPTPVVHTAANHAAASAAAVDGLDLDGDDAWYVPLSLHHMGGLAPLTRSLPAGVPVVLSDTVAPDDLIGRIRAVDATVASVVPTMVHRALDAGATPQPTLRCLLVGGAPLREALFRRAREAGYPLWASYGLTETIGLVAAAPPTLRDAYPGTVGRSLPGIEVRVLDADGEAVPDGELGQLEIASATVSPTSGTVVDGTVRLRPADIGHRDGEGRLWVHGRLDAAIQTGGELVHPQRVEGVLAGHPDVADAAVIGLPDEEWGERVVAAVVTATATPGAIRAWSRDALASYEVPKTVVTVDEIPRTVSGTVDREALSRRLIDG